VPAGELAADVTGEALSLPAALAVSEGLGSVEPSPLGAAEALALGASPDASPVGAGPTLGGCVIAGLGPTVRRGVGAGVRFGVAFGVGLGLRLGGFEGAYEGDGALDGGFDGGFEGPLDGGCEGGAGEGDGEGGAATVIVPCIDAWMPQTYG